MVDFSHANSCKQFKEQINVGKNVANQIANGESAIIGVMIESHLQEGAQDPESNQPLVYGRSITDGCIGWNDSVALLQVLAEAVKQRRSNR